MTCLEHRRSRGATFRAFNGRLGLGELRRQTRQMHDTGLGGTVSDGGLETVGRLTTTWALADGHGWATRTSASAVDTDVAFCARGDDCAV